MATTTNFDAWLDVEYIETEDERDDLIESVEKVSEAGNFATTRGNGGQLFVKGIGDDYLMLATPKAQEAFLALVRNLEVEDELEAGYRRNIENPHA